MFYLIHAMLTRRTQCLCKQWLVCWCSGSLAHFSPQLELLMVKCQPFYLPKEFTDIIIIIVVAVYIPPNANANMALWELHDISKQQTAHPDGFFIIANHANLKVAIQSCQLKNPCTKILSELCHKKRQHAGFILYHHKRLIKGSPPPPSRILRSCVMLLPAYRPLLIQASTKNHQSGLKEPH